MTQSTLTASGWDFIPFAWVFRSKTEPPRSDQLKWPKTRPTATAQRLKMISPSDLMLKKHGNQTMTYKLPTVDLAPAMKIIGNIMLADSQYLTKFLTGDGAGDLQDHMERITRFHACRGIIAIVENAVKTTTNAADNAMTELASLVEKSPLIAATQTVDEKITAETALQKIDMGALEAAIDHKQ